MKKVLWLIAVLLLTALVVMLWHWKHEQPSYIAMPYADLGETRVLDGGRQGLVIVLFDAQSERDAEREVRAVAVSGRVVALVNIDTFFAHASQKSYGCLDMTTLLDVYAQHIQQELHFDHFDKPSLIGFGSASAYLQLLLAQAPAGIFSAGVSIDNARPLLLPVTPCSGLAQQLQWHSASQPIVLPATIGKATPWVRTSGTFGQWLVALDGLLAASSSSARGSDDLSDLPLVPLPQESGGSAPFLVVLISGDGGWSNIDKDIAEALGQHGIAVVGWNALRYFWEPKTPETMAVDLARVLNFYTKSWGKSRVLLVGYSLGADVLPFMVTRLPSTLRPVLQGLVLLSPSRTEDFQFHVSDWLNNSDVNTPDQNAHPLLPEMTAITALPVLCMYGEEDDEGLCPLINGRAETSVIKLPGDHHFGGDYDTVTNLILQHFLADTQDQ